MSVFQFAIHIPEQPEVSEPRSDECCPDECCPDQCCPAEESCPAEQNPKCRVGDVVRLRSGGPHMTVRRIFCKDSEDGLVFVDCNLFRGDELLEERFFLPQIVLIESPYN